MKSNSKHIWKEFISTPYEESRDLSKDSVTFLHGSPLLKKMPSTEIEKAYNLIGMALNESFMYFEKLLIFADFHMRKKETSKLTINMKPVDIEELYHLEAFRFYNSNNKYSKTYYTMPNGEIARPGYMMKSYLPGQHKLILFLIKLCPEAIYSMAILFERFSVDVGKTLIKDHGKNHTDSYVRLHYLHLKDEIKHINVCESKMKEVFSNLPLIKWPLYILISLTLLLHFLLTPFIELKNVIANLPTIKKSLYNRILFYISATGITQATHPIRETVKVWSGKIFKATKLA